MEYKIAWTDLAVIDLERIDSYIRERSPQGAETVRGLVFERVDLLSRFPEIGPIYERDRSGKTRELVCGEYRIFYRINNHQKQIEILTVWHGSRREPRFDKKGNIH